jgi:DNA-binding transcriptional MerR regulator
MKRYKIEDVSKECGLTKRTIRYYEQIGLLYPPERSEGGFRLYSDVHIERLKQIISARDMLGISLQDLQEFVSMSEDFNNQRQGFRETEDEDVKREKILEIERTVGKQMQMIELKLEKLTEFRNEMHQLYNRVLEAKAKINS